jgi:hypothetical protein
MPGDLIARLTAAQAASGAVRSFVTHRDRAEADDNALATALTLRALRGHAPSPALDRLRRRALDFLERCASPHRPGAFGFWPPAARPAWGHRVPDDVDDTAIVTLELALHGRRAPAEAQRTVWEVLVPALLPRVSPVGPRWIRPGVFRTWLDDDDRRPNPVDCCANANALALLAHAGLTHVPGYREACAMIADALQWAGPSPFRLRTLSPYYPNPRELLDALEHAVACGAVDLRDSAERLRGWCASLPPASDDTLCSNAYGGIRWSCPALRLARQGRTGRL